jgi:hypothetical protein
MPPAPSRGWFARNWWKLLLAVVFGSILLCGGICAGVIGFGMKAAKEAEAYQVALKQVQQDPKVIERLGKPVEDATWMPSFSYQLAGGREEARYDFKVSGPQGTADVHAETRRTGGPWEIVRLDVIFADGQRVSLDTGSAKGDAPAFDPKGGGDAPKWKPSADLPVPKTDDNEIQIELPK